MRTVSRNNPIATVIKNYMNKKSGKVTDSRNEIQRRFLGLDWEDQKHILEAFLESGKTDRNWAYSGLLRLWDDSFETKVLELWETYHEERCAWVVVRHCSEAYIINHLEELSVGRNYYFICLRMAGKNHFVIERSRLSGRDFVLAMHNAGRVLSHDEALDILYSEVSKWCLSNEPFYEVRDVLRTLHRTASFSSTNIPNISTILYYLFEMRLSDVSVQFHKWDNKVNEVIQSSTEVSELNKKKLSDWGYNQQLAFIAQKYLYHALPQQYKIVEDEEFDKQYSQKIVFSNPHYEMLEGGTDWIEDETSESAPAEGVWRMCEK